MSAALTPTKIIRGMIEEVIWWHAVLHDDINNEPVTYQQVMGESRMSGVVRVRFDCIRRIHAAFPAFSTPHLGRIFKRDHSTIMYALNPAKFCAKGAARYARVKSSRLSVSVDKPAQHSIQPEI